jgi:hypothetical protein
MVRIAISQAAFDAIAKTLPIGSVGYENKVNEKGEPVTPGRSGPPSPANALADAVTLRL